MHPQALPSKFDCNRFTAVGSFWTVGCDSSGVLGVVGASVGSFFISGSDVFSPGSGDGVAVGVRGWV